jgi:hypothetical protein
MKFSQIRKARAWSIAPATSALVLAAELYPYAPWIVR